MKRFFLPPLAALVLLAADCASSQPEKPCIDEAKICKDCPCTMDYKPVCGCDGKTYTNACQATNAGVTAYTEGECK